MIEGTGETQQKVDLDEEVQKRVYLDGIRKIKNKGIRILFDGKEKPESSWEDLFRTSEDGGFYRRDYTAGADGFLEEIRFDWVYNH